MNEEIRWAFQKAAIFTNRFVVTMDDFGFRLAFMEQSGADHNIRYECRGAFVMTRANAAALHELLGKMLTQSQTMETKQ